jgi:hypothetical protein
MEWQSLGKTCSCEGQDSEISLKETGAAILMLPSWRAGDHEDITAELIKMGGAGLHTAAALWKMNIVWEQEIVPQSCGYGDVTTPLFLHQYI